MPTWEGAERFYKDFAGLTPEQRLRFKTAVENFIADLRAGNGFRAGLRVKRVEGTPDVYEMTWAPDGRATWQYGSGVQPGEPHVIWRRVGTHDIFRRP